MARIAGVNRTMTLAACPPGRGGGAPPFIPMLAEQDWPDTGSTIPNVRGSNGVTPFPSGGGNGALSVVNAAAEAIAESIPNLAFMRPTNLLRVDLVYNGDPEQNMDTDAVQYPPRAEVIPPLPDGATYFYSLDKLNHYNSAVDPGPLGNNNHCLEEQPGSGTNYSFAFYTNSTGECPVLSVWVAGTPTRFQLGGASPIYIPVDTPTVYQWSMTRDGSDRSHGLRVWTHDGVDTWSVAYTTTDFATEDGGTNLLGFSAAFSDVLDTDGLDLGTNGPNVVGATQGFAPAWYFGRLRISDVGWEDVT